MKILVKILDGIVLVNKPSGITSNAVLQRVKRLYQVKKAGHTGSLDPLATGMLPICLGEATKWSQYLLDANKCYDVTGMLGIKTSTADRMGEIINIFENINNINISENKLLEILSDFKGVSKQIPSMYSALKHNGVPLYKLARQGLEIERAAREITIEKLELTYFNGSIFKLKVVSSKGTYMRNLVEDIGDKLGVGAHVTELHRCYTAGFEEENMIDLEVLEHTKSSDLIDYILPADRALSSLPLLNISENIILKLRKGQCAEVQDCLNSIVRLYDCFNNFIGLGEIDDHGILKVKRLIAERRFD